MEVRDMYSVQMVPDAQSRVSYGTRIWSIN
jgi:hypothetical protein